MALFRQVPPSTLLGSGFNSPTSVAVDAAGNVYRLRWKQHSSGDSGGQWQLSRPNPTITILASGFHDPVGLAVDGNGNLFAADQTSFNLINEIPRSQPPALSFASTNVGSTSSDSPQSVQFQNIGNATLTGSGVLSDTTDFTVVAGPGIIPDCTIATLSLAPGAACNLSIDFTPQSAAPISATITATDNTLNANPRNPDDLARQGRVYPPHPHRPRFLRPRYSSPPSPSAAVLRPSPSWSRI